MYMHIRSHTLQYVHYEPMCSVMMGNDDKDDYFHDHDERWSRVELQLDLTIYLSRPTDHIDISQVNAA